MTLGEWIQLYEKKTSSTFKPHPDFQLFFFPERGFCEIALEPKTKMVMAYQLCGDGHFWKRVLEAFAMAAGYEHCGAICIRHVKPYMRFFGFRILCTKDLPDGSKIYYGEDKDGLTARLAPAWKEQDDYAYYVTWEVKNGTGIRQDNRRHPVRAEGYPESAE